jgi:hypothetical protein
VEKIQFSKVEPAKSKDFVPASDRDANNDRVSTSGPTVAEMHALLDKKISELIELQVRQSAEQHETNPLRASTVNKRDTPITRGATPGRMAAEYFFEKTLRGTSAAIAKAKPPPSDPSNESSSSSSDSSSSSSADGPGSSRRGALSRRLSSKRKRGHARKHKMLLKPIPPSRYNGEPNANAIQRFARESKTYVKMGRVPEDEQVYFISYYLDGKALDFYNQVVVPDEESWDLKHFFIRLFEFCFPVDFRNGQRKHLSRCFQGAKDVAAHIAEWSEIYNTIGLEDTQEKIVMLFNSFTYPIQTEIYRKGFDPEVATWDEIVKAANAAEILVKIEQKNRETTESGYQSYDEDEDYDFNEDEDADAPAENDTENEDENDDPSVREHGGRVEAPQPQHETMRAS